MTPPTVEFTLVEETRRSIKSNVSSDGVDARLKLLTVMCKSYSRSEPESAKND